jgi:hypothetical protein
VPTDATAQIKHPGPPASHSDLAQATTAGSGVRQYWGRASRLAQIDSQLLVCLGTITFRARVDALFRSTQAGDLSDRGQYTQSSRDGFAWLNGGQPLLTVFVYLKIRLEIQIGRAHTQ